MEKLNVKAAGLAFGILWGLGIFLTGIISTYCNWGAKFVEVFSDIYIGYNSTILGSIIGGAWAFADGAICGIVLAWLYNKLSSCHCSCKKE